MIVLMVAGSPAKGYIPLKIKVMRVVVNLYSTFELIFQLNSSCCKLLSNML